MISICTPSRNRPETYKRLCLSILATASNPDDIEFIVYRDDDDISVYEYVDNYKEIRGKRIYPDASYNECQKVANGPLFLFTPDDMIFETKGWDEQIKKAFNNSKDKIIFVYFRDNITKSSYGSVGCLHKNWIDTVGYFFNPILCRRGDVWINQIAKNIKRKVCLWEAWVRHEHIVEDKTHVEYDREIARTNNYRLYNSKTMREARNKDTRLLLNFINKNI